MSFQRFHLTSCRNAPHWIGSALESIRVLSESYEHMMGTLYLISYIFRISGNIGRVREQIESARERIDETEMSLSETDMEGCSQVESEGASNDPMGIKQRVGITVSGSYSRIGEHNVRDIRMVNRMMRSIQPIVEGSQCNFSRRLMEVVCLNSSDETVTVNYLHEYGTY